MTLVAIPQGLMFPPLNPILAASSATMDAATEKVAHIGHLFIAGRPAAAKTLSTGSIQFRTSTSVFANGATTLDIGIQDVATSAGPIAQPDGTFDVKTTLTGGAGISSAAWNTATMTSGSKDMTHGDLIAVVFDMTARGGADSVPITGQNNMYSVSGAEFPVTNVFISSAWQTTLTLGAGRTPNVIIVFDDGTLGWLDETVPVSAMHQTDTFSDSTNPDERGMIFQVPWDCKIDALWFHGGVTDANSDYTFRLFSDPTGTPSTLATATVLAEQEGVLGVNGLTTRLLATEVSLTKATNYGVAIRATGSSNVRLMNHVLGNEAHRAVIPGTTTLAKITRDGGSGAFTAESPALTMYQMGVRISQLHDGSGGSGGMLAANLRGNMQ